MKLIVVERPEQGNPLWPLPRDYSSLSVEGRRQARVNACRQWLAPTQNMTLRGDNLVGSLKFFDDYYLRDDEEDDFISMFYDDKPMESPPFHDEILRAWATYKYTAIIAPRGSAKSKLNEKDILLRILTRPLYSVVYASSTHENAQNVGQNLRTQIAENRRIADDFWPDAPSGRLRPGRGEASFSNERIHLTTGSWVRTISSETRQRGSRPRRYRLDDPEYDERQSTSMEVLRDWMERFVFKVVMPMVQRPDCGLDWLATFVSKQHYAYHALQTREAHMPNGEVVRVPADPRFDGWFTGIVKAAYQDNDGKIRSCWPAMWPATREDKDGSHDERRSLEEIREDIGTPAFNAEYLANPGVGESAYFFLDDRHNYNLEHIDPLWLTNPRQSTTEISWLRRHKKGNWELQKMSVKDFLAQAHLFITVDSSYTDKMTSDFKVACLMALTSKNELFVLDLWCKRAPEGKLIDAAWDMAMRWGCRIIGVETIKESFTVYNVLRNRSITHKAEGAAFAPFVKPLKPGSAAKESRIAVLRQQRFGDPQGFPGPPTESDNGGLIKFPSHMRMIEPWRTLFDQVEGFNPEANNGGLQHDDCIDTVSMSNLVIEIGLPGTPLPERPKDTILELLKKGVTHAPDGTPHITQVDFQQIPYDTFQDMVAKAKEGQRSDARDPSAA